MICGSRTINVFVTESVEDQPQHELIGICSHCAEWFRESELTGLLRQFRMHTCSRIIHSVPVPMVFGSITMMPR